MVERPIITDHFESVAVDIVGPLPKAKMGVRLFNLCGDGNQMVGSCGHEVWVCCRGDRMVVDNTYQNFISSRRYYQTQ